MLNIFVPTPLTTEPSRREQSWEIGEPVAEEAIIEVLPGLLADVSGPVPHVTFCLLLAL
jgi:hypothetical protein